MSVIQNELDKLSSYNVELSADEIVESFRVKDIKEYIAHLQSVIHKQKGQVYELTVENETMKVQLEKKNKKRTK